MNKIQIFDLNGNSTGEVEINEVLIVQEPHTQAIFDAVIAERASQRQGTHSTLTKGEVRGGGKKPYQQKHTGRARQGSIRNPHYVGGGIAFGPKPTRNYTLKVNKKVSQLAFKSALSQQIFKNVVVGLIDEANPEKPSAHALRELLNKISGADKKILIILGKNNDALNKSARNLQNVILKNWNQVSTQDLLDAQSLVVQPSVLTHWVERMH